MTSQPWPRKSLFRYFALTLTGSACIASTLVHGAETVDNKFDIWEFRVLGDTVLPVRSIESAVYPLLGPSRSMDTVKQAAAALEKAYSAAGYGTVFVDIPEQEVNDGIVRLKVTEGRIERIRVRGAMYFSGRQIRAALPAVAEGQTPQLPALQQQLTALNAQTPDRTVTPVLKAGSVPGSVDLELNVKDKLPLHGSVQYDNRHTADSTPNRLTGALAYNNLWQRLDAISLLYETAPANPQNVVVESGTYSAHLGDAAGVVAFSYIHTSSNVLALGTLGVLGSGNIYGIHWSQPVVSGSTTSQSLNVGVDYKDVTTEVFPNAAPSTAGGATITAPVAYANWSGTYTAAWQLPSRTVSTSVGINFGIDGFVNKAQQFANSRYNALPGYFYVRLGGSASQNLPLGFSLFGRVAGQWSDSPLVNNEQFSLGGADSVRGYLEAESLGDSGIAGSFEIHAPNFGRQLPKFFNQLSPFVFIDSGVATLLDPLPGQSYNLHLWSTGGGFNFESPFGLSGSLDYALAEANGTRTRRGDGRVDFLVRYGF